MHGLSRSVLALASAFICLGSFASERPNILWITAEDHGPHLGCYGDGYASTPRLDSFAAKSLRYDRAISNAPVCAAARTALIAGVFPASLGAQHMRSRVPSPEGLQFYPELLRAAGYYCTNNHKEDYNLTGRGEVWDESSRDAHWKNRPEGQPFFAIFNAHYSHESQLRNENENPTHDPAEAPLAPYWPDNAASREAWAQYYDRLSKVDDFFAERMAELEEAGLAEDTIVFFYADHGSGMPRHKRYPGWSGVNVPLIVHVPEKFSHLAPPEYRPGGSTDRLVGFVDLPPTLLSIVGAERPDYYHGHAFMGAEADPAPEYAFAFRGRMDERPDFCRAATDGRYYYIRNFYPFLPHGQFVHYQQQTPATRQWYLLFKDGKLDETRSKFWRPHPAEELYDLAKDPHETNNLAGDPAHADELQRLRAAVSDHMQETRDLGFLPEGRLQREFLLAGKSPRDYGQSGEYPLEGLLLASRRELVEGASAHLAGELLDSEDPLLRFRGAVMARGLSLEDVKELGPRLIEALEDEEPAIQALAAETLLHHEPGEALQRKALDTLFAQTRATPEALFDTIWALNALERLRSLYPEIDAFVQRQPPSIEDAPGFARAYYPRLWERFAGDAD